MQTVNLNQDVFERSLRIFEEYVEIAILVEHARVEHFVFQVLSALPAVGLNEVLIRIGARGYL